MSYEKCDPYDDSGFWITTAPKLSFEGTVAIVSESSFILLGILVGSKRALLIGRELEATEVLTCHEDSTKLVEGYPTSPFPAVQRVREFRIYESLSFPEGGR